MSPLHGGVDRNVEALNTICNRKGRLFTEAWIETAPRAGAGSGSTVASSRRRGSKRAIASAPNNARKSPLHGGVDRNAICILHRYGLPNSRLFTEAWIETDPTSRSIAAARGSPLHGGVDRNTATPTGDQVLDSRLFTEAWIETPALASSGR